MSDRGCSCAKPGETDPRCVAHGDNPEVCWSCLGTGTVLNRQSGPYGIDIARSKCRTCKGTGAARAALGGTDHE